MEYNKDKKGKYNKAKQKSIDFGGGVERTLAVLNKLDDNYLTSSFLPIVGEIERISGKKYKGGEDFKAPIRIIADHIKAATMILADEKQITPSNIGQGYVLRRLIRRAIRYGKILGIEENFTSKVAQSVFPIYYDYPELKKNRNFITTQLEEEENKFRLTLERGLRQFKKMSNDKKIDGKEAFLLFQSYGFPIEMTEELAEEKNLEIDIKGYEKEYKKHQTLSRTASAGTFKSGLADDSDKTTKLHTAAHLLLEALRQVLGPDVRQKGSNINPERIRFDFSFSRKLTPEEIKETEYIVNEKIKQGLNIIKEEMSPDQAFKRGAQGEFGYKYPEKVSVYTVVDKSDKRGFFSKEICTGPHVKNTKELGTFKITKEQSSSSGVRRIKAKLEEHGGRKRKLQLR